MLELAKQSNFLQLDFQWWLSVQDIHNVKQIKSLSASLDRVAKLVWLVQDGLEDARRVKQVCPVIRLRCLRTNQPLIEQPPQTSLCGSWMVVATPYYLWTLVGVSQAPSIPARTGSCEKIPQISRKSNIGQTANLRSQKIFVPQQKQKQNKKKKQRNTQEDFFLVLIHKTKQTNELNKKSIKKLKERKSDVPRTQAR